MLNPFIELIATLIRLYSLAVIIWAVLSLLINFDIINRSNLFVMRVMFFLNQIIEPALRPIRRLLNRLIPALQGVDISPIILLVLLQFVQNVLYTYFWNL